MTDKDKALVDRLRVLREEYEQEKERLLDEHMAENYTGFATRWMRAMRASLEVASWPEWKRKACYGQEALSR